VRLAHRGRHLTARAPEIAVLGRGVMRLLVISNAEAERVLTMDDCLPVLEEAFHDLGTGQATNRPRTHTYTETGPDTYYLLKTMDGAFPRYGVHALRLSSDAVSEVTRDGQRRREKLPLAPGGRYLGTTPSSGLGIQFAAVCWVIYRRAREQGLGQEVPTEWFLQDVRP
jgi:hypothetical protein